jgi:DNA polymerase-3 subunit delta
MKLRVEQLASHLQNDLKQVYFLSGDEPLQMMEASDLIRDAARKRGYAERDLLAIESPSDWAEVAQASIELSLFSSQKFLDVRLKKASPGKKGSQVIRDYMASIPADKVLLLQSGKLDRSARNSAWVKALDKHGVMIQVWDMSHGQTLGWIAKRMRMRGMQPSQEAVTLLTERVEGNLLSADQEIMKLHLLFGEGKIDVDQVMQVVSDSSRFSVFDLSNAVLMGDSRRIHHVLRVLREEGTALQLVLWSLSSLSRQLYDVTFKLNSGGSIAQSIGYLPRPRQALFRDAIGRLRNVNWSDILQKNAKIDRMSKGTGEVINRDIARVWEELLELAFMLSGRRLPLPSIKY